MPFNDVHGALTHFVHSQRLTTPRVFNIKKKDFVVPAFYNSMLLFLLFTVFVLIEYEHKRGFKYNAGMMYDSIPIPADITIHCLNGIMPVSMSFQFQCDQFYRPTRFSFILCTDYITSYKFYRVNNLKALSSPLTYPAQSPPSFYFKCIFKNWIDRSPFSIRWD